MSRERNDLQTGLKILPRPRKPRSSRKAASFGVELDGGIKLAVSKGTITLDNIIDTFRRHLYSE
jgi:hypothetical protein